ncbi:MAG: hypothetical protein R3186_02390 [Ruegeria sp.]|nr:hypothetical protein [Ruegeria sp.]
MTDTVGPLRHHEAMGSDIRAGTYTEHATSTYTLAEKAILNGAFDEAADLAEYTIREGQEAFDLFPDWMKIIPKYMCDRGVDEATLQDADQRIQKLIANQDGSIFDPAAGWRDYKALIADVVQLCARRQESDAIVKLSTARSVWRDTHDRLCDGVYGWVDAVARTLGEAEVGLLWDHLMSPMYGYYDQYDTDRNPWVRSSDMLIHIALEGLRGHLTGPGRKGDLEVEEQKDRWAIRFDPCGSGGRTMRDDPDTGTGPRIEAPYGFGVTTEQHDWAWNKTGVCLYCAHCCVLNEQMPIRRFGYPTRVVEPPTWPAAKRGGKCTWYIYKDPVLVPDDVYRRTGNSKPAALGGSRQKAPPETSRS